MSRAAKTMLLLGASSDIGRATALVYAKAGWSLMLASRRSEDAQRTADDIAARTGANASILELDILQSDSLATFADMLPALPDTVVCVIGDAGRQETAEVDVELAVRLLRTNFEGPALLLGIFARRFAERGSGVIVGVSSVAGDRGRASNYVYGSAKAGFSAFLSGLRARLSRSGVRVVTIKPGFVRTRMTASRKLPPLLTATAAEVAQAIHDAAERPRGRDVVYVRPIWRAVMWGISALPEFVFKKLRF